MHSRSPRWWLHQLASLAVVTAWAVSMILAADRLQNPIAGQDARDARDALAELLLSVRKAA